jgi:hypothetical protein
LAAVKGSSGGFALCDDLDSGAVRDLARGASVNVRNDSKKAMGHQTALNFLSNLFHPGVEYLSQFLVVHGVLLKYCITSYAHDRSADATIAESTVAAAAALRHSHDFSVTITRCFSAVLMLERSASPA